MEPSLLEPGRSEPAVERDARRRQQGVELDLLDHRVPAAVLGRRGHELLRNRAAGADPEADEGLRGAVPNALLRSLDQVGVLQVVGVIGSHRIRVKDVGAGGSRERLDDPRGGLAALAAVGERRRRRVQRDDDVGREGFARSDIGGNLPAVEGIAADVGVECALGEQRARGRGSHRLDANLLRVVAGVERQLVTGAGAARREARRRRRARRGGGGRPGGRAACHQPGMGRGSGSPPFPGPGSLLRP